MATLSKFVFITFCISVLLSCTQPKEHIRVGVVLPLSGPFQIYGEYGINGAKLAVDEINKQGGVLNGHLLELIIKDNKTNPAESVLHSRQLIQTDNVLALMGPVSSAARYAMQEVASKFETPQLYGIDYEGQHFSRYLICYSTIPEHYINPVIPYLLENSGPSFYIFGYDYIWPHRMSERITQEVNTLGGTISEVEFTPFGVRDYSKAFERIKSSGADNLMLILPGADGFNFLNQMAKFDFGRNITTVAFAADETYLNAVNKDALEGVLTALHFFSSWESDTFSTFVNSYRAKYGADKSPTYSSKSHYDLIYLLKAAIEKSGSLEREAVTSALEELSLYSGESEVTLRTDHHFDLPMYLAQFTQGQLVVIKNLGHISPADQRKSP